MSAHNITRVNIPPRKLVVITAPSGAGKSTIVKKLLRHFDELAFSVSCTTRARREGEVEGQHYHFISVDDFKRRVANGEFLEYQEVYPGQFYGTLKTEVEKIWNNRKIVLFDIDVKGADNLKKQASADCLTIFIDPPSKEVLVNRLKNRATEDAKSLKTRIKKAEEELGYANRFDKIVVNADFDTAYMRVKNIITSFIKPQTIHVH